MKRSKRMGVLLAVLAGACAATVGVVEYEEKKEAIQNTDEVILQVSSDKVRALSWEYGAEKLGFHKDETWKYDDDEAFPVDEEAVAELLEVFEEFGASFIIEDVEDYGQYGLDDPVCTIKLTTTEAIAGVEISEETKATESTNVKEESETEDGILLETDEASNLEENRKALELDSGNYEEVKYTYEIKLGSFSTMDSKRYVSIGDGNVYLVSEDPFDEYEITISDMILHDQTVVFSKVKDVIFSGMENYTVVREEESSTYNISDVYYAKIDEETRTLDSNEMSDYLRNISYLNPKDYVNYKVTDEELVEYGLGDPELSVTVHYTYEDEEKEGVEDTFVIHISRNQEEVEKAQEEAEKNDSEPKDVTAYVRIGESPIIYQVTDSDYDDLTKVAYDDLRHKEVFWGDFGDVYQVDIQLEDVDYTLNCDDFDKDKDEGVWKYQDDELDVSAFKSALLDLKADSFTDEEPEQKLELGLKLYLENENVQEVSVELYRYDGEYCLAMVDGEAVSLVKRSQVVELMETVNAIVLKGTEE